MRHYIGVVFAMGAMLMGSNAFAVDYEVIKGQLATFLGVDKTRVAVECPQRSFSIQQQLGKPVLHICLNQADNQKRCEITVNKLPTNTTYNHIKFDAQTNKPLLFNKQWYGVMQIHSVPDEGESWRCPPIALVGENNMYHMQNRWDPTKMSVTSGYNCTEPGSSIKARALFTDIAVLPGVWRNFDLYAKFAYDNTGHTRMYVDGKRVANVNGPNTFNDPQRPFLKLGIYKPSSWEKGQSSICIDYRNVKIETVDVLP